MKPEKQLYQWDVNQYLTELQPTAEFVDYPIGNEVIRLETDGTRCRIPDEILQTCGGKTCYERYPDGTYRAYSFTVLYAPKPPDYVYTPEERTTFEALTARVDAAIEEIKRRADSGEFTPVKGVDYFTEAEKTELMESVSTGAIGEFRKVVDSATTEYNDNHKLKLDKYNANASEKLTTYDANAEQHTTDYNRNAAEKLEAYNQNHAAKVAEYNANAEAKTAEFDSNAAALQEQIAEKANVDGYYEEMTVGDAEQLISTQFVEDNKPYLFRPTGGSSDVGNRAYIDKIVGGTVAWNQQVDTSKAVLNTIAGVTLSRNENGKLFLSGTATGGTAWCIVGSVNLVMGHKYLSKRVAENVPVRVDETVTGNPGIVFSGNLEVKTLTKPTKNVVYTPVIEGVSVNTEIDPFIIDLTQMFGSTIADYIYSLEQSQAGAGVAWFKKLFPNDYYAYNAGELLSVEGLQSHDAVGFNQWDEEWEVGSISPSTGNLVSGSNKIRSKNFIPILPNTDYYIHAGSVTADSDYVYFYTANKTHIDSQTITHGTVWDWMFTTPNNARYMKFIASSTTYNHDICINLSSPTRNGEYEPYEKHSYPLDSSLTLRGIPKLDASNNLYYDGDEYASDGTVTRKYGVVDLGTLDWRLDGAAYTFGKQAWLPDKNNFGAIINGYTFVNNSTDTTNMNKIYKTIRWKVGYGAVYIKDTTYTDAATFKAAMSGVMLVYELATPTTETAEPFQYIQVVDDFGTEEFVSSGFIPAGHMTRYPANLRDKLQHLPDLASMDGTYLIQQTGKQMSLVYMPAVFPNTPTDDGTYTLKTVVTGGVATLQWVAE